MLSAIGKRFTLWFKVVFSLSLYLSLFAASPGSIAFCCPLVCCAPLSYRWESFDSFMVPSFLCVCFVSHSHSQFRSRGRVLRLVLACVQRVLSVASILRQPTTGRGKEGARTPLCRISLLHSFFFCRFLPPPFFYGINSNPVRCEHAQRAALLSWGRDLFQTLNIIY